MDTHFLKNRSLLYHAKKTKGVNFVFAKKIQSFFGFSFKFSKYKYKYYSKINVFFNYTFIKIIRFIKRKFTLLKHRVNYLFNKYKTIGHYKGKRLIFLLPLNGQRTHTNAKTIKRLLNSSTRLKKIYGKKKNIQEKKIDRKKK
jgi:ribosomal protein S13